MASPTCFPDNLWIGRIMTFPQNGKAWKLVEKTDENWELETQGAVELTPYVSWGTVEFRVESQNSPGEQARLVAYLQLPYKHTEGHLANERAKQALKGEAPPWPYRELEAWKRLSTLAPPVTSTLLDSAEQTQGPNDPVPGGWALFTLITMLPGVPLGDGASTRRGGVFCPRGIFWEFIDFPLSK